MKKIIITYGNRLYTVEIDDNVDVVVGDFLVIKLEVHQPLFCKVIGMTTPEITEIPELARSSIAMLIPIEVVSKNKLRSYISRLVEIAPERGLCKIAKHTIEEVLRDDIRLNKSQREIDGVDK